MWRHIPTDTHFARIFLYVIAGIFLGSLIWQAGETVYTNGWWFQSVSLSQNGSYDYIQVRMTLRKPVKVEPGQYINLWIPLGPLSGVQSHPFTVANWSTRAQTELKVFVGVNRGLTSKLQDAVKRGLKSNIGLYMGPYGSTIDMKGYETILLVATGLGVVAVAPYLQWLVHAIRAREICSAPVHLIWHIPSWKQAHAVFDIIDFALALDEGDDTEAGDGKRPRAHISGIKISMCYEEEKSLLPPKVQLFIQEMERKEKKKQGRTRVKVYNLHLPLKALLISDTVMSSAHNGSEKPTMIAASVSKDMRSTLVEFAGEHSRAVDLVFTDYQP
ncbi:Ferric/cupric reductase transmembrane component 2 [Fusarium oxysporum f. sp. rapae]|uniref:Ferric/cupric reductase transmembrane component 2 n=1 Tax=Fusarium oxysporum f. sp. rapae TaxID=485398 RepID=A0A8J5NHQ5_FUSOX|nr:Ferric/cupric reductase transmembrane component 2 [Fusarium oxysporum f. sp. rapae]